MIDTGYLIGLFGGTYSPSTSTLAGTVKRQPTAPWSAAAITDAPKPDALVRAAVAGRKLVNEGAAKLDLAGSSADYRKLFALYQGLQSLSALATRSGVKGVTAIEQGQLGKAFTRGLDEISAYLSKLDTDGVNLVQGTVATTSKTTAGVARDSTRAVTAAVHQGDLSVPVAAFQGETKFTISVSNRITNAVTPVAIDLDDMGSTPRTMDAVLAFINTKLEGAGLDSRMGREQVPTPPSSVTVNGKPVTLPSSGERWALTVKSGTVETVSFSAADTSDAVYVSQGFGTDGGHQLLKFQSDGGAAASPDTPRVGESWWVDGRVSQSKLPDGVKAVRASAVGPDGSVWLVADLDAGPDNQPIKGQQDVGLLKFDSAGRLLATRSLGAASTASGYAIAIDDDGRVAVAGSVTGGLEPGAVLPSTTVADSFVTVFDKSGEELWTQRRGARAADEATSVSFGADGMVYVAGRAQSGIPGSAALGGWDGYVQAFTETQVHDLAPIVPRMAAGTQFGTAGNDGVDAITVDGSNLYSAGVENGRAVVRRFTLDAAGLPTLAETRDLGNMSGSISGVAVSNGRVIVTGTTKNAALDIGTINTAHSGGSDAFVAVLNGDLAASGADRLTYYGAADEDTVADAKVHDGKVWLTGVADRGATAKDTDPSKAYLTRIDPLTGAVEYTRTWQGDKERAMPATLSVASGGASVLDRLGLPNGEIVQKDSKLLTAATSLRVGDRFSISPPGGGRAVMVTIAANDTLQTLARKIEQASQNKLKVTIANRNDTTTAKTGDTTTTTGGFQYLSITARDGRGGAVLNAGETGRDALAGLGLSPGLIGPATLDKVKTLGLNLSRSLNLDTVDAAKTAAEKVAAAMRVVRDAYKALDPETSKPAITGQAPAYLQAQLANYQAALQRLGGYG
ncbi:MAG: transcriptional regulator [Brevundimonas sp.]|nr:MAG: transcriptional regulator [Brevundimonas sp.]